MQARRVGPAAWVVNAPAKLNLYLEILGRRVDGFHELETLMAPVRLYDQLRWSSGAAEDCEFEFRCYRSVVQSRDESAPIPTDASNLAWRAADVLSRESGIEPYGKLELWKRIPAEAGLGGGSSDAAAALLVLNRAWKTNFSLPRLQQMAAQLGSDVPFFLSSDFAIGRGRGERLETVPGMPRLHTVVVKPAGGVSTAQAYGLLRSGAVSDVEQHSSRRRLEALIGRLRVGAIGRIGGLIQNRLQAAAISLNPQIEKLERAFRESRCPAHAVTGCGSAYFGVLPTARSALHVARTIFALQLGAVYVLSTRR